MLYVLSIDTLLPATARCKLQISIYLNSDSARQEILN